MTVIYQTTITRIGASATDALSDQMLITFREGAPADLEEYCFIHCHGELKGALHPGLQFTLGRHRYPVTAVGSVAEDNLRELGHVTLRFDGLTVFCKNGDITNPELSGGKMPDAGRNMTWDLRAPAPTPSHLRATVAIKGSFRGAEF
ncbi:TPA: PTS glucitol/sorbitol transporter subunit IIA [Escherichia coli]|nr:PTS glucitol/sorbitol transporter subunit IIA [Escherichia coli]KDY45589.1 PTS system glucitol/sorbitol-specific IIA component family protein [Escherichia coli 2-427-07_S4_C2]KEJ38551.1 PTS system glucitol/sorbitol-specific IIA component family protein [Escherichia coli 2-460-02_S1_C3]KEO38284.1 PTS system glucitol/sorbitol-specific IIA component family protein [Escherichia coli 2-460-02_S1_C2]